jgi:hypothetical protein
MEEGSETERERAPVTMACLQGDVMTRGLYVAALVELIPSILLSWLLQYCFPSCKCYVAEIVPRAAKCPIMLGFCRSLTVGCSPDNGLSGVLALLLHTDQADCIALVKGVSVVCR